MRWTNLGSVLSLLFCSGFTFAQRGHGSCGRILAVAVFRASFRLTGVMSLRHLVSPDLIGGWGRLPGFVLENEPDRRISGSFIMIQVNCQDCPLRRPGWQSSRAELGHLAGIPRPRPPRTL